MNILIIEDDTATAEFVAGAFKQVGYATRQSDNIPHIGTVEKEKLILLLIMQMMRIG